MDGLNYQKKKNKEIFELTIGGLGLTGTIVNITLNLSELKQRDLAQKRKSKFN